MFRKALLALAVILVTSHAARATGADSGIRVTVVDAQGAMISDATAYLKSSTGDVRVVRSDEAGCAEFPNVPVGFYDLRVVAPSYSTATTSVELRYGESRLEIRAVLVKPLVQIGYVHARSTIDVQNRVLRRDAGLGRLSVTLADLLNTLGGAQVRLSSNGSLLGISLRGQDPSLTMTTFNGVSISGSQALRALDPDLMQSASINDQKESVDFRSLGTAPYPIYDAREMINGYAGRQVAATVQGTSRKVGYAAATSVHGQQSALAGLSYADTSGLTYRHDGGYLNRSNSFKLAVPLSENVSLRAETMLRTSHEAPLPAFRSGPVPQGFGPGNVTDFNSSVVTTGIEATAGQWSLRGTLLNLNTADANDSRDRIVALQPSPDFFHRETSVNAGSYSPVRSRGSGGIRLRRQCDYGECTERRAGRARRARHQPRVRAQQGATVVFRSDILPPVPRHVAYPGTRRPLRDFGLAPTTGVSQRTHHRIFIIRRMRKRRDADGLLSSGYRRARRGLLRRRHGGRRPCGAPLDRASCCRISSSDPSLDGPPAEFGTLALCRRAAIALRGAASDQRNARLSDWRTVGGSREPLVAFRYQ